jgi:hypothetical protein
VGNDFEKPSVLSVTTYDADGTEQLWPDSTTRPVEGIEKNTIMDIRFSEEVNISEVQNSVQIVPGAKFYIISTTEQGPGGAGVTRSRLRLMEPLVHEQYYTLTIRSSISDLQNNPLDRERSWTFRVNGTRSIAPVVLSITDPTHPAGWAIGGGTIEPLTYEEPPAGSTAAPVYRDVSITFSAPMEPSSMNISIQRVLGGGGGQVRITAPRWPGENGFSVYRFNMNDVRTGNTYKIIIKGGKGGTRDQNGNYLKEDFVQMVRF